MEEIKLGSKVELNTGGPPMTVKSFARKSEGKGLSAKNVEDRERVTCQWFDGTELKEATFPITSLKIHYDGPLGIYQSK